MDRAKQLAGGPSQLLDDQNAFTMLTPGIAAAFLAGVERLAAQRGVTAIQSVRREAAAKVRSALFLTTISEFLANPSLRDEVFGPVCLLVAYSQSNELFDLADTLEGQLTASSTAADLADHDELLIHLERKAGRSICNGYPTGV